MEGRKGGTLISAYEMYLRWGVDFHDLHEYRCNSICDAQKEKLASQNKTKDIENQEDENAKR